MSDAAVIERIKPRVDTGAGCIITWPHDAMQHDAIVMKLWIESTVRDAFPATGIPLSSLGKKSGNRALAEAQRYPRGREREADTNCNGGDVMGYDKVRALSMVEDFCRVKLGCHSALGEAFDFEDDDLNIQMADIHTGDINTPGCRLVGFHGDVRATGLRITFEVVRPGVLSLVARIFNGRDDDTEHTWSDTVPFRHGGAPAAVLMDALARWCDDPGAGFGEVLIPAIRRSARPGSRLAGAPVVNFNGAVTEPTRQPEYQPQTTGRLLAAAKATGRARVAPREIPAPSIPSTMAELRRLGERTRIRLDGEGPRYDFDEVP